VSHPIDPKKLLKQAEVLAGVGAGRGRPSTTNHRRAVSAAYYALFQDINLTAARYVLPDIASDEEIQQATRWVNHKDLRYVCEAVATCAASTSAIPPGRLPKGLSQRGSWLWEALSEVQPNGSRTSSVPLHLRLLVVLFVTLQTARHSADYDHLASFPKAKAIVHVSEASLAMQQLHAHVNDPYSQRLFAWIFARASGFVA
jgi:hypothetical protein